MIHFTDATGLLGDALAIAAVTTRAPGMARLAPQVRGGVAAGALLVSIVPLNGLPLAGYLRGAIGDLSLTSVLLLALYLARATRAAAAAARPASGWHALLALVAATALVFYPMALGWGSFDPYRLGYGSSVFLACLLALALWGVLRGRPVVAAALAVAVAGWSAGWYESTNLWDYLMDPLLAVYALGALATRGMRRMQRRTPSQ